MSELFNLENAIAAWRRLLRAGGINSSEILDELESHLREDIEHVMRSGKTSEEAFRAAVTRLGPSGALAKEFCTLPLIQGSQRPKYLMAFSVISAVLILWTGTAILLETGIHSLAEGLVFAAIFTVAAYLAALPFCYRKLPSLQNHAVQKAVGVTALFVNVWIVLALLNAVGRVQFHLPEDVTILFWSVVPALFATILAYDCYRLARKRGGHPQELESPGPEAKRTLALARDEARKLHHDFVGTEHVLLALLRSGNSSVDRALRQLGLGEAVVRAEIEKLISSGPASPSDTTLPLTPRARNALACAMREADAMGREAAGCEHLFLGLLAEPDGVAGLVLRTLGVNLEKARAEILKGRGPDDGEGPEPVLAT